MQQSIPATAGMPQGLYFDGKTAPPAMRDVPATIACKGGGQYVKDGQVRAAMQGAAQMSPSSLDMGRNSMKEFFATCRNFQVPGVSRNEGLYFGRELEKVSAKAYDVKYVDLEARQYFPIQREAEVWNDKYTITIYDMVARAIYMDALGEEAPLADVSGVQQSMPIVLYGAAYGYDVREMLASQAIGKGLEQRRMEAAMRAMKELDDQHIWWGSKRHGIQGILNHSSFTTGTVAKGGDGTGAESTRYWSNKTGQEIVDDITTAINTMVTSTNKMEMPDTLILGTDTYHQLLARKVDKYQDTTIWTFLFRNSPYINDMTQIICSNYLNGSGKMILYNRSPQKVAVEIPMEPTPRPPQITTWGTVIAMWASIAGVVAYYPKSYAIYNGISATVSGSKASSAPS